MSINEINIYSLNLLLVIMVSLLLNAIIQDVGQEETDVVLLTNFLFIEQTDIEIFEEMHVSLSRYFYVTGSATRPHHNIWLKNSLVRGSFASSKKVLGGPCSTMTPRSVK